MPTSTISLPWLLLLLIIENLGITKKATND